MLWRISNDNPFVYANEIESPSIANKLELYDMAIDFFSNEGHDIEVSFLKECLYCYIIDFNTVNNIKIFNQ